MEDEHLPGREPDGLHGPYEEQHMLAGQQNGSSPNRLNLLPLADYGRASTGRPILLL